MSFDTIKWDELELRAKELAVLLASSSLETAKRVAFGKELARLSNVLDMHKELLRIETVRADLEKQKSNNTDAELATLFQEEIDELASEHVKNVRALEKVLFPSDERDNLSVFLEIRAGAGGQEAALFAGDLARMYMMYATSKNWKPSIVDESPTDLGGFKEIILHIQGKDVFGHLKFESGVHRVQRVPATEGAGRIHTSTATVAVLPEAEGIESITINPSDLRIDTYRAGGAGGQHVNKTDSAVRITHIPTGLVVACQEDRSQHKNKAKALKVLQARLDAQHQEKHEAEMSQKRREAVGGGMRAEKVRTYNFPQNRVTDHQVNVTLSKLDMVMNGDLDDIIEPLREHERQERRKQATVS